MSLTLRQPLGSIKAENWRVIHLLSNKTNSFRSISNEYNTARYTLWNLIPKNIFNQFQNAWYLWFLFISILQLYISPNSAWSTGIVVPFLVLIFLILVTDGYYDLHKHKYDHMVNNKIYQVWDGSNFSIKKSKDIRIGEIIKLRENEYCPVNILLLCAKDGESEIYVDVAKVIGEASFDSKKPVKETMEFSKETDEIGTIPLMSRINATIKIPERMSQSEFKGSIRLESNPKSTSLSISNCILRGSKLIGVDWVLGVVMYVNENPIYKQQFFESNSVYRWKINKIALFSIIFAFVIISISLIYNSQKSYDFNSDHTEFCLGTIAIYSYMLPISLFILLRLIKSIQSARLRRNHSIRLTSLKGSEDLGQIEYILTDKTGTVTNGDIQLKTCVVDNETYTRDDDPEGRIMSLGSDYGDQLMIPDGAPINTSRMFKNFIDLKQEFSTHGDSNSLYYHFIMCMVMCNSGYMRSDKSFSPVSIEEKAIIETCKELGIELIKRTKRGFKLIVLDEEVKLKVIGFQRRSHIVTKSRIVVKNPQTGKSVLYVSGSRESMLKMFSSSANEDTDYIADSINNADTANKKIILLGYRDLSEKECEDFEISYHNSRLLPVISEEKIEDLFTQLEKEVKYLGAIGLEETVLEETKDAVAALQKAGIKLWMLSGDNEENTLCAAFASGILETNVNVAQLTNIASSFDCTIEMIDLIKLHFYQKTTTTANDNTSMCIPSDEEDPDTKSPPIFPPRRKRTGAGTFISKMTQINLSVPPHRSFKRRSKSSRRSMNPAVLSNLTKTQLESPLSSPIDADTVHFVLSIDRSGVLFGMSTEENRKYFATIICAAECIVFHSLLPEDKVKIVKFLRERVSYKPIILAIGDGASDWGMIQQAHVGVGIIGCPSEYSGNVAIRRFSQLKELLLYQGHTVMVNVSKIIYLSYFMGYLTSFVLFFYCNAEGSWCREFFDRELIHYYFFMVTFLPILANGVFDEELSRHQIDKNPKIYRATVFHSASWISYFKVMITAFMYAIIIYFPIYSIQTAVNDKGFTDNAIVMEITVYFATLGASWLFIIIETRSVSKWTIGSLILSLISVIIYVNTAFLDDENYHYGALDMLYSSSMLILYMFMAPLMCFTFTLSFNFAKTLFSPDIFSIIRAKKEFKLSMSILPRLHQFKNKLESIYRRSGIIHHSYDSFEINPFTLRFRSQQVEKEFQIYSSHNSNNIRALLVLVYLSYLISCIYEYFDVDHSDAYLVYFTITLFSYLIFVLISLTYLFPIYCKELILTTLVFNIGIIYVNAFAFHEYQMTIYLYWSPIYLLGASGGIWIEMTTICLISWGCLFGLVLSDNCTLYSQSDNRAIFAIETISIYLAMCIISAIRGYSASKTKRIRWTLIKKVEGEIEKSEQVLSFVLPAFVRKRVKDGIRYITEDQGVVSVLFCDIDDFENIITNYPSSETAQFLDEIYKKFDIICEQTGVTKIETVGNVYMACAGLKDSEAELPSYFRNISHARRTIEMGLKILSTVEKIYLGKGEPLRVNIGIHTGPVTAGVVGYHKPQFSLVGDTVNTASRMASTLKDPSMIQISENTLKDLDDKSGLAFIKQTVDIKGKGPMNTILVSLSRSPETTTRENEPLLPASHSNVSSPELKAIRVRNSLQIEMNDAPTYSPLSSTIYTECKSTDFQAYNPHKQPKKFNFMQICPFNYHESLQDKELRTQMLKNYSFTIFGGFIICCCINWILLGTNLAAMIANQDDPYKQLDFGTYAFEAIFFTIPLVVIKKLYKNKSFGVILEITCVQAIIIILIMEFWDPFKSDQISANEYLYLMYFILLQCTGLFFKNLVLVSLTLAVFWIIAINFNGSSYPFELTTFAIFYTFIIQFIAHYREKNLKKFLEIEESSNKELEKIEALLTQMMPSHVFENLREEKATADTFSNVTILYADIVGFTAWSSNKDSKEVVGMLSEFFTRFDKLCVENNIYKVHTIGDCYVAMSLNGIDFERNPSQECLNVINFAQSLLDTIDMVNTELMLNLSMRIGIHTGSIIGGIAGATIVRYDIYGADVLIANKMESNGVPGSIAVSEDTMTLIESYKPGMFDFEFHKEVAIPSINRTINAYILQANVK